MLTCRLSFASDAAFGSPTKHPQQTCVPYCRLLINQIDSNHKERKPEGLACNVMLIRELNNNIQTVIKLYQDLSAAVESIGTPEH